MNPLLDTVPLYVVGVDVGGTKIGIVIADLNGTVVYRRQVPTSASLEEIDRIVRETAEQACIPWNRVKAAGFGLPGITNHQNGIVIEAPALQWTNVPFGFTMERHLRKPVYVQNDVNCAAWAEHRLGEARGVDDFVFLAIGTGVGSAIFANGSLVNGADCMAGEIAYMMLDEDILRENSNTFGHFGKYESRISGSALSQHGYSSTELFRKYTEGDGAARAVLTRYVTDLAIGIANIASLLNPQKVVIGGGVSLSLPIVLGNIRDTVARLTPVPVTIELSAVGEEAGAIGAAFMALERSGNPSGTDT